MDKFKRAQNRGYSQGEVKKHYKGQKSRRRARRKLKVLSEEERRQLEEDYPELYEK